MKTLVKVAWVVSENATYLNFLGRYVEAGGFVSKKFLSWEELKADYEESAVHSPDLIVLHSLRHTSSYQDRFINQVKQINPMQIMISLSTVKLMATVQLEQSFDNNKIGASTRNASQRRLVKAVSLIDALSSNLVKIRRAGDDDINAFN